MTTAVNTRPTAGPDRVLRALADPTRRQILRLVRREAMASGDVARHFDMTQQAVSLHLQVLRHAGLLHKTRKGAKRMYSLNPEPFQLVDALLDDLWPDALGRLKSTVEADLASNRKQNPQ
ncbi:transcriptional regulator [Arthrobacter stackebrandtii]|nr:metalloregulator ArsR/SmtB family transcription factor [Arthrobacter stackebrandtii]PYH01853.1 transcriptional regulator [Arthrobacter stackebrandtii]